MTPDLSEGHGWCDQLCAAPLASSAHQEAAFAASQYLEQLERSMIATCVVQSTNEIGTRLRCGVCSASGVDISKLCDVRTTPLFDVVSHEPEHAGILTEAIPDFSSGYPAAIGALDRRMAKRESSSIRSLSRSRESSNQTSLPAYPAFTQAGMPITTYLTL